MSKWRPSDNCIYVISDIHGMINQLELILSRILPLRKTGGNYDMIIFLGDYIDRRLNSYKVIDRLIDLKDKYKDQIITLQGNHELMFKEILNNNSLDCYKMWMGNGGEITLSGYLEKSNSEIRNPYLVNRFNIKRFIPSTHIDFFNQLKSYYEIDNYQFVHGGCDPFVKLEDHDEHILAWDRSLFNFVNRLSTKCISCPWDKVIITGHNGNLKGNPFIYDKFMMLDGSAANNLYVIEIKSGELFSSRCGKKRLVKENY